MVKKSNKKSGYCVYFFAHRGIGKVIITTNNMEKTKNELMKDSDTSHIVCDADQDIAIQKYNNLKKASKKFKHPNRHKLSKASKKYNHVNRHKSSKKSNKINRHKAPKASNKLKSWFSSLWK